MTGCEQSDDRHDALPVPPPGWRPKLGDLVTDRRSRCLAVVVAIPGDHGPDALTFHLTLPGGGKIWSVPGDGSTLRPAHDLGPPLIRFAVPGSLAAARRSCPGRAALPFRVHLDDGTTQDTLLVRERPQVPCYSRSLVAAWR